jgi:hypothetical protein
MIKADMNSDKYRTHRLLLHFLDSSVEDRYRKHSLERSLSFTKATWFIVALLAIAFSILDTYFFGAHTGFVLKLRLGLVILSMVMFVLATNHPTSPFMDWNGFIFVAFVGLFCNILIFLDETNGFSLWFAGLFFVYPGVFTTAGIGFRYSFFAMLSTAVVFNLFCFQKPDLQINSFLIYNVFLGGMLFIYTFLCFLVETIFRNNYITLQKLKDSLDEVKKLSGLLPMCAKCKKIRDDEGYWQQVETYIQEHTDAKFSHGLCPACLDETYGDKKWYQKKKEKKTN